LFEALGLLLAACVPVLLRGGLLKARRLAALAFLGALAVFAWVAMPLTGILTGKIIQPYHYRYAWFMLTSYVGLAGAAIAVESMLRWARTDEAHVFGIPFRSFGPSLFAVAVGAVSAYSISGGGHVIWNHHPRFHTNPRYRADLSDLARVLASPPYQGRRVLGTLDPVIYEWWVGLEGKFASLSDPFLSTRPDVELEARFMAFCDQLGVSEEAFRDLLRNRWNQVFWVSYDKFDTSPLKSVDDGSEHARGRLHNVATGNFMTPWNIIVPNSEVTRMSAAYRSGSWKTFGFAGPDIVVLTTDDVSHGREPRDPRFKKTFSNPTFVVWVRS
jgi:hypothetical protein